MLSVDGQRTAYAALHRLAHETAGGRWIATGGGGYELVQVVPRAWTHLLAEALGHPLDPATADAARAGGSSYGSDGGDAPADHDRRRKPGISGSVRWL